jgi:hypothetical protein
MAHEALWPQSWFRRRRHQGTHIGPPTREEDRAASRRGSTARLRGARLPDVWLPFVEDAELSFSMLAERFRLVVCLFSGIDESDVGRAEARRLAGWISHEMRWLDLVPSWLVLSDTDLLLARSLPLATCSHGCRWAYSPATVITANGLVLDWVQRPGDDDAARVELILQRAGAEDVR